ncbi:MAG: peptidylprolyl isomerase [Rhodobiaceae bacterium]|nr:peptidylprolyl isomerase [Rhodobiaceae bacterium]
MTNSPFPARRMRHLAAALLFCTALVPAASGIVKAQETTAAAVDPNEVVITVNGVEITNADVQMAVAEMTDVLRQVPPQQHGEYILSFLTDVTLVSQEAEKEGFAANEDFKRQLTFLRNKALVQAKLQAVGEAAATEEAIKARYEEAIKDFQPQEEVRARHILVKTEEEAKSIKAEIDGGKSFEDLAKEHSTDGSSQNGGDLGYFTKDMMVAPFGETAFALEVGEVSDPIKTQFGWHIIKLEDKRMSSPPKLEEVRAEVVRNLIQTARRDYIKSLREGADIVRKDEKPAEEKPAE